MFATAHAAPKREVNPEFARDVHEGLTGAGQKTIPASWLYDEVGSALFEAITVLPEYGLTRADSRLLERASRAIVREAGSPALIVELGSGTGTKTRHVLSAAAGASGSVTYCPIDISRTALQLCCSTFAGEPGINLQPIESTYEDGVFQALQGREENERALLLFLGSTIGNFSRPAAIDFFRQLRRNLRPGDTFLLGADLVKERRTLLLAYDDPAGVTAAFNKNLLARINRELDADFNLHRFTHLARYNEQWHRIEMHLRSDAKQSVRIGALGSDVQFNAGETIWTESSHKFEAQEIARMGDDTGWRAVRQWIDHDWGFSETLFAI